MMIISLVAGVVLFIIAVAAWWYLFFGTPNPPLSQTTVSIQSSTPVTTTPTATAPSSDATATVSTTSAPGTASSSVVAGENPPLPDEQLSIDGATFTAEIASSALEQSRGLSFRPSLAANAGMLFIFGSGSVQTFWMKDMNFPLDMIWISGNTVDGFSQNVPAPGPGAQLWELPIYPSPDNTDKVLEVNAGTVAKYNIKVGDTVTIGTGK